MVTSAALTVTSAFPFLSSCAANPTIKGVGTQLFWLGEHLENDLDGGFKLLSNIGYKEVQLYGPYSFSNEESWKFWNEVAAPNLGFYGSGLFGRTPDDFAQLLEKYDLSAKSLHSDLPNLEENMPRFGELADKLGIKYVVLPIIAPELRQNLDDFKRMADRFNRVGELAKQEGLVFTYHNHGPGWTEIAGEKPARYIFDNTDPDLVKLELDIYWMIAAGEDPVELLKSYEGRFVSLHLADMTEIKRFSGDGSTWEEVIDMFEYITTPGSGKMNIQEMVETAAQSGVELFYLEQDPGGEIEDRLRKSYEFLSSV